MNRSLVPTRHGRTPFPKRFLPLAGAVIALSSITLQAAEPPSPLPELRKRLAQQAEGFADMETLRASYSTAENEGGIRQLHEFTVRLKGPIQVVSERHEERDIAVEKEYFLHENDVYAMQVWYWATSPDGKIARVSEERFFFEKGTPIYHGVATIRVPASTREPDLTKSKEISVPLMPGVENLGAKLKIRAFTIARSFRPQVGKYVFGDWDAWLLKNAPAEDPGLHQPERPEDWMPPKETRVLPIRDSDSPNGLFRFGWGYEKAPVDWARLASEGANGTSSFSTKLASGELKPPLSEDANYLMNGVTGEPVSNIGLFHPGERQRFNHDEFLVYWSQSSRCFIARETQKWADEMVQIGWIKDGKCEGTFDIIEPITKAVGAAVKKSSHPAAKRIQPKDEDDGYGYSISKILVDDDGHFEAAVNGVIPKDLKPGGWFETIITGKLLPGSGESPAVLKDAKVKVLPWRQD